MYVIIAYDISDDNKRNEIREFLRKYLYHVQKSVFEGKIKNEDLSYVVKWLLSKLDENDRLIIVTLSFKNFKRVILGKKFSSNLI